MRSKSRTPAERGAVLVEAAMVFMILFTIIFGVVEFSLQLKDTLSVTNAVRAAARSASADPRDSLNTYNVVAVSSETTAQAAVGNTAPQVLWVYKADPSTGFAVGDSPAGSFTSCTYCEKYSWDLTKSPHAWTCIAGCAADNTTALAWLSTGNGTNSAAQYVCVTAPPSGSGFTPTGGTNTTGTYSGPDSIGIYLKISHKNITGFFGSTKTITDHAVARLEPIALNQACWG